MALSPEASDGAMDAEVNAAKLTPAQPTKPEFLAIGRVVTTFGLQGELKVEAYSDDPKRFGKLKQVRVRPPRGPATELQVASARVRGDGVVLLKFEGYDAPETAAQWRGCTLEVPFTEAKRKAGTVLYAELPGLAVLDADTMLPLGRVVDVWRAVQDLIVVKTATQDEALVPWVPEIVVKVDPSAGHVLVRAPAGLLD